MSDSQTLVRVLDELVWRLRRAEFDISTGQAIDVARAVTAVGLADGVAVRRAIASVVVSRSTDRPRFEAVLDDFFAPGPHVPRSFMQRLRASGFEDHELEVLRETLIHLGTRGHFGPSGLVLDESELDRALAASGTAARIDAQSAPRLGFEAHRLLRVTGLDRSGDAMRLLRSRLSQALGARGEALADAVAAELGRLRDEIRSFVQATHAARVRALAEQAARGSVSTKPFSALTESEVDAVRRALRTLAERLKGRARVRSLRASRGRVDVRRTFRASLDTGGVPFVLRRKGRRRDRTKMVLLCDISDSVKTVARLLLEFTYAVHELFEHVRTFVFVSDLGETTDLFRREPPSIAVDLAWRGAGIVDTRDNSNYGRVLRIFEDRHLRDLDRDTMVVLLGDGRSNYHDSAPTVLDRIRSRTRALFWLCTESRGEWAQGDSAMGQYAPRCTAVHEVKCAADLERVGRTLVV